MPEQQFESIRRIWQELPLICHVILGVSNVSFGLNPAAKVKFWSFCTIDEAGMDAVLIVLIRFCRCWRELRKRKYAN